MGEAACRFDYSGSRVLVTGGSNGIGAGIAAAFLAAGAEVVITGTRPSASDYDHDLSAYEYYPLEVKNSEEIERVAGALGPLGKFNCKYKCSFPL